MSREPAFFDASWLAVPGDINESLLRALELSDACVAASHVRGDAFAFTTQARMDWYAWMHARDGQLIRRVVYADGALVVDDGIQGTRVESTPVEFSERAICAIASRRAVGPLEFADGKPVGGVLAMTREWRSRM